MIINYLTTDLTDEQKADFTEACNFWVDYPCIINVKQTSTGMYSISFYNVGIDYCTFAFVMSPQDFDFITYAYKKLLQAGSELTHIYKSIAQKAEQ